MSADLSALIDAADRGEQAAAERLFAELYSELHRVARALAEIVDLKFFCGFSFAEVAALHGVTERTVQRRWARARIFPHRALRADIIS